MNNRTGLQSSAPTFDRSVFDAIHELCGGGGCSGREPFPGGDGTNVIVSDKGVFSKAVGIDGVDWLSAVDACEPGSSNSLIAPLLPFPFTAAQLAAFILDGWSWLMHEAFGGRETGLDEALLEKAGVRGAKVREAVRATYQALREAATVVPGLDEALQQRSAQLGTMLCEAIDAANRVEGVFEAGKIGRAHV